MKIYTKTGDTGHTSLAKGGRVLKSDVRVEMYGTCDELNSNLGLVLSFLENDETLIKEINLIQNLLFEIGSELAGYKNEENNQSAITQLDIEHIEKSIDSLEEKLVPLKSFILPGGSKSASFLHVSRTICRRLERIMVLANSNNVEIFSPTLIYINRLSDFLFVASRYANSISGINEPLWTSRLK
jgi:cob(I)alamin adenosyltransferase